MTLPELLKKAREKKGWSQAELADRLGVSPGTVGGWESDKNGHGMRVERMHEVATLLGVAVDKLFQAAAASAA